MNCDRFLNCSTGLRPPVFSLQPRFGWTRTASTYNGMHELMMSPYGSARTVTRLIPIIERLKRRFPARCPDGSWVVKSAITPDSIFLDSTF
jgi:Lhr-like helicases